MSQKTKRELLAAASAALEKLQTTADDEQKKHFLMMLALLTTCYGTGASSRGVLILANKTHTTTMGINADEFEIAGMVDECHTIMGLCHNADKPAPEMLN